jgi:hypothetical protein
MRNAVKGAVVLVTGANSGIGAATARAFARAGARVVATGRDQARLGAIAPEVDCALTMDVTSDDSVDIASAAVLDRYGGVDVVVNNAGIGLFEPWDRTSDAQLRRVMEVDFFGAVRVAKAFLPALIERRGVLTQVASVAGRRGYPRHTAYCAAKHALVGWSEALRQDVRGTGVSVVIACPPAVATPFFENAGYTTFTADHPRFTPMSAEGVAAELVRATLARDRQTLFTPRARALYALSVVAPGLLDRVRRR